MAPVSKTSDTSCHTSVRYSVDTGDCVYVLLPGQLGDTLDSRLKLQYCVVACNECRIQQPEPIRASG